MKFSLILLASGMSKRFGKNKLLFNFNGKQLIDYPLELLDKLKKELAVLIDEVIIVTSYGEIFNKASKYSFKVVINNRYYLGISESIKLGVKTAKENNYKIFMVSDQPNLKVSTIKNYILNFIYSQKSLASLVDCEGNFANPCIFSPKYNHNLLSLKEDKGGRQILKRYPDDIYYYQVLKEEVFDIDFTKDLLSS